MSHLSYLAILLSCLLGVLPLELLLGTGILPGVPIGSYDRADILGPRLAYAPIEDLGFGFALILLPLSSWVALGRRARGAPGAPPDSRRARPAADGFARRWRAGAA